MGRSVREGRLWVGELRELAHARTARSTAGFSLVTPDEQSLDKLGLRPARGKGARRAKAEKFIALQTEKRLVGSRGQINVYV
jgi:hypothetical protein